MKKIIGNTIELKPLKREDLDIIAPAWDEFMYVPFSDRSKDVFYWGSNNTNSMFNWDALEGKITLCIYKNNSPIGLTIIDVNPEFEFAEFRFSILLPEHRGAGVYSELNILRHKFAYSADTVSRTKCRILHDSAPQQNTVQALYTRVEVVETTPPGKTFTHSYITRDEWEAWINHEDQIQKLNSIFEVVDDI